MAVFVTFAISNRHFLVVNLFPLPYEIKLPVFILILLSVIIGTILSRILNLGSAIRHMANVHALNKRIKHLEKELLAQRKFENKYEVSDDGQN
jgi:uncharacterized integral membrane protein